MQRTRVGGVVNEEFLLRDFAFFSLLWVAVITYTVIAYNYVYSQTTSGVGQTL